MAENEIKEQQPERPIRVDLPINMNLLYINGGNVSLTPSEIQITGTVNGRPQALIVIPIPIAKTFAKAINQAIGDYERKTSTTVLEPSEIAALLKNK